MGWGGISKSEQNVNIFGFQRYPPRAQPNIPTPCRHSPAGLLSVHPTGHARSSHQRTSLGLTRSHPFRSPASCGVFVVKRWLIEHRPLPPRRPDPRARAAGVAAVAVDPERRPTADDVARILRGRSDFPRAMIAADLTGAC